MRNSKLRLGLVALFVLASAGAATASILLTDFGSAGSAPLSIDSFLTTFSYTQDSDSVQISGSDFGSILIGGLTTVDISSEHSALQLFGTATGAPATAFSIKLYDSAFKTAEFVTNVSGGITWPGLQVASPNNYAYLLPGGSGTQSGFNWTQIIGMDLTANGSPPGSTITADLTHLYAIPEPSSFLVLAGLAFAGLLRRRVRR